MKIKSLHLENYRCFDDSNIVFDKNMTVVVGINGSGKTSILEAMSVFLKMYASSIDSQPNYNQIQRNNLKHGKDRLSLSVDAKDANPRSGTLHKLLVSFEENKGHPSLLVPSFDHDKLRKFISRFKDSSLSFTNVVYYSSKRVISNVGRNSTSKTELKSAFENAFSPQIDFSSSLAWFIEKSSQEALEAMRLKNMDYRIPELSAVRIAVSKALGEYGEPFVGETPPVLFIPQKDDPSQVFRIEELSDGYRTMLALVMDLARRMAVANSHIEWPDGQTVLYSPGVVLIDEVELHLHPSWQQRVLPSLMEIFPNVQFIVTTHSPQVLTSIGAKHIRILQDGKVHSFSDETEGAEAGRVLEDVLGVKSRPDNEIVKKLGQYTKLVYTEKWDTQEALELKAELEEHYGRSEPRLKELELHIENSKWERGL
ncbi:AAA family ATPase [Desulfococcaceae bacterium OttesenSCG-928-F15]|nr:AAA family ATPase [Desulfococcaceae bacterium OttesenSCG-928-F15]